MNLSKSQIPNIKDSGMTLPEVSLSLMVLIIFMGVYSVTTQYIKSVLNQKKDSDGKINSWTYKKHKLLTEMDKISHVISQPSYSREQVKNFKCQYINANNRRIWNLPLKNKNSILTLDIHNF